MTKASDDGTSGTLRWAIQQSEQDGTDSVINVQVASVALASDLPNVNAGFLTLDGQGVIIAANGSSGLQVRSSNNVVRNLTLSQSHFGLQLVNVNNVVLFNVTVRDTSSPGAGLTMQNATNCAVQHCTFANNAAQGILVKASVGNSIGPGNHVVGNLTGVVFINTATDNALFQSEVRGNAQVGIGMYSGSVRNLIGSANQILDHGAEGVVIDAGACTVLGNEIRNCGSFGVYLTANGSLSGVDTNVIDTCGYAGVFASQASSLLIARNQIVFCHNHYGIFLDQCAGCQIGPANAVGLCDYGGIYLNNSDPCTIKGNVAIGLNFGAGIVVASNKPRASQQEILIQQNRILLNHTGVTLGFGSQRVRLRLNRIFFNVGSGIEVLGDLQNESTSTAHAIEGNILTDNGYSGISSYFASGVSMCCNLASRSEGPGLDIQHGGVGDLLKWNAIAQNGSGIQLVLASNAVLEDNQVQANHGHGIQFGVEANTIRNNTVLANRLAGLATLFKNSATVMVNNTLALNGIGIAASGAAWNNIAYYNSDADVAFMTGLTLSNCNVGTFFGGDPDAGSNFSNAPQFRNLAAGDIHLLETSPCKNAGSNGAPGLPATDFDASPFVGGDARILEGTVDVGADESGGAFLWGGGQVGDRTVQDAVGGLSMRDLPGSSEGVVFVRSLLERRGSRPPGSWLNGGPTTYLVTNLNDAGPGSLRLAMDAANRDQTASLITFAPNLSGTIAINTHLPVIADLFGGTEITGSVLSDGVTPKIKIACAPSVFAQAFIVTSSGNILRNLEVDVSVDAIQVLGKARFNLLENVRVRNIELGLAFGLTGADDNILRRCVASNNLLPGFYFSSGADRNVLEDCVGDAHQGPAVVFEGCSSNDVYGTTSGASHFSQNDTGIAILNGSQDNTIGPNVSISLTGWNIAAGVAISLQGMATRNNVIDGVQIQETNGFGVQLTAFASQNDVRNTTIAGCTKNAIAVDFAPDTTIDGCFLEGRSQASDAIVYCSNWSPDLHITNSTITAHGAINGMYLSGAPQVQVIGNHLQGSYAPFASGVQLWSGDDYAVVSSNTFGTSSGAGPDTGVSITDTYGASVHDNVFYIGNSNGQARDCGIFVGEQGHAAVIGPSNLLIGTVATSDTYGIYLSGTSLGPDNVVITHNRVDGRSLVNRGLMAVHLGVSLAVDGNDFAGCTTNALQLGAEGTTRITNNLIRDNSGTAILLPFNAGSDQPQILFNTIVCNTLGISGDARVWYNILWSNSTSAAFNLAHAEVHCNDVQGRASLGLPADNADVDPRFVAPACGSNGNYHLRGDSPLIDFACSPGVSPPARPPYDYDGDARPEGSGYDVGLDE